VSSQFGNLQSAIAVLSVELHKREGGLAALAWKDLFGLSDIFIFAVSYLLITYGFLIEIASYHSIAYRLRSHALKTLAKCEGYRITTWIVRAR
jgi:hypothetical protein